MLESAAMTPGGGTEDARATQALTGASERPVSRETSAEDSRIAGSTPAPVTNIYDVFFRELSEPRELKPTYIVGSREYIAWFQKTRDRLLQGTP